MLPPPLSPGEQLSQAADRVAREGARLTDDEVQAMIMVCDLPKPPRRAAQVVGALEWAALGLICGLAFMAGWRAG